MADVGFSDEASDLSKLKVVVLVGRRIVERTVAAFDCCHWLAKDWESLNRNALTFLHIASIHLVLPRR